MNATLTGPKYEFYQNNMSTSMGWSIALHVAMVLLITFGVPYIKKPTEPVEIAITVELADLSELNQSNQIAPPQEEKSDTPKPPPEHKPIYNSSDSVPELSEPQKPDIEDIPEPPKEKPEIVTEIKSPPKPRNKPRRPKPSPPKPAEEAIKPKEDQKDFTSLLRSLTPDQPEEMPIIPPPIEEIPDQGTISQIADFAKDLTRSEMDNLNRGVQPCWNVNAGGKYAEELKVTLRVFINTDMSVREVRIIDQARYNSNSHFRAAADAARRALLNPRCSKLNLPEEKYDQWKVFKYHFDPSHML